MKKFLKILLKVIVLLVSILAIIYLITLSYCSYEIDYKPYRGLKFDKKIWSGESKLPIEFVREKKLINTVPFSIWHKCTMQNVS
jgi:hypothetical protein